MFTYWKRFVRKYFQEDNQLMFHELTLSTILCKIQRASRGISATGFLFTGTTQHSGDQFIHSVNNGCMKQQNSMAAQGFLAPGAYIILAPPPLSLEVRALEVNPSTLKRAQVPQTGVVSQ